MNQSMVAALQCALLTPATGDGFRPWIAAVILILSIIVLVAMIVLSKRGSSDAQEDSFRDEDDVE